MRTELAEICDFDDCPRAAARGVGRLQLCEEHANLVELPELVERGTFVELPLSDNFVELHDRACCDCMDCETWRRAADSHELDALDHIHLWVELARCSRELRGMPMSLQKCGDCDALRVLVGTEIFPLVIRT